MKGLIPEPSSIFTPLHLDFVPLIHKLVVLKSANDNFVWTHAVHGQAALYIPNLCIKKSTCIS